MADEHGKAYYKHNRTKQLRAFCFAAQSGSISKAAERLFLSQPSVSLQIQALERELGITLFERRGPRIRLTPDGETLYELAQPLVEGVDALPEQFAARSRRLHSGRLDVAAGESTTLYLLPDLIRGFMDQYPGVHVKLHNLQGRELCQAIRQDEVDFAVGSMLDLPDDINYRAVYSYGLSLITPPDHPLARRPRIELADLAGGELIVPPRQLTTWRLINLVFQQHSIPYRVRLEVGGWEIIKRYVELGFGIAIASDICLTGAENIAVRPLPDIFPRRTYGVMTRRGKFLSHQAKRFIELMKPDFFDTDDNGPGHNLAVNENVFIAAQ
jgi:DNA-binding transcriptional LysR family regulator